MTRVNSSGEMSTNRAKTEVNASLTHTSMGPSSASTVSAAALEGLVVGGVDADRQGGAAGAADLAAAAASSPVLPRARRATRSPRAANMRALARPMPPEAPVMTTTRGVVRGWVWHEVPLGGWGVAGVGAGVSASVR